MNTVTVNPLDLCKGCAKDYEECRECPLGVERKAMEKSLLAEMREKTLEKFLQTERR